MANTAPPTKSCLKAPVRNPWVSDDVTESSNSSSRATSVHSQPTTSHSTPTPASLNGSSGHEAAVDGTPKHAVLCAQAHAEGGVIVVTSSSSPPVALQQQQQQHHHQQHQQQHYHHHHYAGAVPVATDLAAMQQQIQHQQKVQQQVAVAPPRPFATPSSGASSHASSSTSSTAHLPTCAPPQAQPITSVPGGGVIGQHHGVPVSHQMTTAGQQPLPQTLLCPPGHHNPHLQAPQPQVSQGGPHQPVVVHTGIQKPWMDPKALWTSPSSPGTAPAIFTVGGPGVEPTPLCQAQHYPYYAPHLAHGAPGAPPPGAIVHAGYMPASNTATSTQWSTGTSAGGGGGAPGGAPPGMVLVGPGGGSAAGLRSGGVVGTTGGEEWLSRCQRCNEVCFVAAQAVFVAGILTGFSLLIAGAVFHRQHQFSDLQVLVYIGAMVSLVCVVLLVIFCAMRQNQRARRSNIRYQGHTPFLDHEAVPLRTFESANHSAPPHFQMTTTATVTADPGTNKDFLRHPDLTNHSVCIMGGPAPHYVPVSSDQAYIQAQPPHARLLQARVCEDDGAGDVRYNRLWKQPHKHKVDNTTKL
ncbi:uncharacterized protein LOC143018230 isoform X2 [Oratosquilla oratoria]|uniref:uncharacterized protein LOC143018230 isoform X2 n=1 Tax=Oratosquilla oratoria TaxID=337810 RepID=UPI003F769B34